MNKIAIFGVPRSGTTWLSQIFNSHPNVALRFQPLFSYGHKGRLTERSSCGEIEVFFQDVLHTTDEFALMTSEMQKDYPRFHKSAAPTHIAFKETRYLNVVENILLKCSDVQIIGVVRNPLAVLASWIQAPKEFESGWDLTNEWRHAPLKNGGKPEEFYGFEQWKLVASNFLRYQRCFPGRFRLISYSELNNAPYRKTEELLAFCGLPPHPQVGRFIADSKSRHDEDPYSVFRANASDNQWSKVLPAEITNTISAELSTTELGIFLKSVEDA
jgi:hypothetical protein